MSLLARQIITCAAFMLAAVLVAVMVDTWTAGPLIGVLAFCGVMSVAAWQTIQERREASE